MASDPKQRQGQADEEAVAKRLQKSLDLIGRRQPQNKEGLSQTFTSELAQSTEAALALCERAMEDLSSSYIQFLSDFKEESDALRALSLLDKAEETWRKGAEVIQRYDADGGEVLFLKKMRSMAAEVLEAKFEQLKSMQAPSDQQQALCLGILGVLDLMLEELGQEPNSAERERVKKLATRYK